MNIYNFFSKGLVAIGIVGSLAGCGEPRAVMLPLQYPDGTAVTTVKGEPVMAGYQTYGSALHANATALYETAKPPTCATCARVGAVVTEPSVLRQATGVLGTAALGTGAVMTGIGVMDYGAAAREGKLQDNVTQNTNTSVAQKPLRHDHDSFADGRHDQDNNGRRDTFADGRHDQDNNGKHDSFTDGRHDQDTNSRRDSGADDRYSHKREDSSDGLERSSVSSSERGNSSASERSGQDGISAVYGEY